MSFVDYASAVALLIVTLVGFYVGVAMLLGRRVPVQGIPGRRAGTMLLAAIFIGGALAACLAFVLLVRERLL